MITITKGKLNIFLLQDKAHKDNMKEKSHASSMNARIIGSGEEVMILAHGYGGDQSLWYKVIPSLSPYYKVLVFDWNFSGSVEDPTLYDPSKYHFYDAFASDLISLLDELEIGSSPCTYVGHSMAAMIGCIASVKRPQLFKRLVLVGGSPRYMNGEDYEGGFKSSEIEDIMTNIEKNFKAWASIFPTLVLDPSDNSSIQKFTDSLQKMRPEVALSVAKTVFYCDEREILDKVTTPCTIVQTTRDLVVPISVAYYLNQNIKGSTVEIIDTEGHFPHLTAIDQFVHVLIAGA